MNGGYDEGYEASACFWGTEPGSLIQLLMDQHDVRNWSVLDLGCGEGKNSAAMAMNGANVTAIDCSSQAIANGRATFPSLNIKWRNEDVLDVELDDAIFDLTILYGLAHCLPNREKIGELIKKAVDCTKRAGLHALVAFNDRSQDLEAAHPGFRPTLLPHSEYLSMYSDHEILLATDTDLHETHPHNNIPHHHSLTRMVVRMR